MGFKRFRRPQRLLGLGGEFVEGFDLGLGEEQAAGRCGVVAKCVAGWVGL